MFMQISMAFIEKIGYFNEKIDFFRKNDFSFKKARRHFLYNNFLLLFVPKVKKMLVRFLRNFAGKKRDPPKVAYSFFGLFSIFFNGTPYK